MTVTIQPDINIVGGGGGGNVGPQPPTIVFIGQASGQIVCGVRQNPVTGSYPIVSFNLYRGTTASGPWTKIDSRLIDTTILTTWCFDTVPVFGSEEFYVATAVDSQSAESADSNPVWYSANQQPLIVGPATNLTTGAFGAYPLLGCDVFLDPFTGEGVVFPNGDLQTVNGLELLSQDLRIRIFTEIGELFLHQLFGFDKGKIIGKGQAAPQVQAGILRTDLMDCILGDPRVLQVLDVQINQSGYDSWMLGYDVMAIGVEDPARLNMVFPYFKQ